MTPSYDTKLSPSEEAEFRKWAKAAGREGDTADYDLRGAWKANAQEASNGHLPDTFKKPNHPTFSEESKYSTSANRGGKWEEDKTTGRWRFVASDYNIRVTGADALQRYFKEREPEAELVLPKSSTQKFYGRP